ncbi:hypothetical protein SLA2020_275660 [Shorea laevis]
MREITVGGGKRDWLERICTERRKTWGACVIHCTNCTPPSLAFSFHRTSMGMRLQGSARSRGARTGEHKGNIHTDYVGYDAAFTPCFGNLGGLAWLDIILRTLNKQVVVWWLSG